MDVDDFDYPSDDEFDDSKGFDYPKNNLSFGTCAIRSPDKENLIGQFDRNLFEHLRSCIETGNFERFKERFEEAATEKKRALTNSGNLIRNFKNFKALNSGGHPVNEIELELTCLSSEDKVSLLHHACYCQKVKFIEYLVEKGANVSAAASNGDTPLHYLINSINDSDENISGETIISILNALNNADITIRNNKGETILDNAVESDRNIEITKAILQTFQSEIKKNKQELIGKNNKTILSYAVESDNWRTIDRLLAVFREYYSSQEASNEIQLIVETIVKKNFYNSLWILIYQGIDVKKICGDNVTGIAQSENSEECLRILEATKVTRLSETDANIIQRDIGRSCYNDAYKIALSIEEDKKQWENSTNSSKSFNNSLWHCVAVTGNIYKIDKCPNNGINSRNVSGYSPIEIAVLFKHLVFVKILLTKGAQLEPKLPRLSTALHFAAQYGLTHILKALVKKERDISCVDENGMTCLLVALKENNMDCCAVILQHNNWSEVVRISNAYLMSFEGKTIFQVLLQKAPDQLKIIFDNCIQKRFTDLHTFTMNYDYRFLKNSFSTCTKEILFYDITGKKKIYETTHLFDDNSFKDESDKSEPGEGGYGSEINRHPLKLLIKSERLDLLGHSLIDKMIDTKWKNSVARIFFYIRSIIYIMFLSVLVTFEIMTRDHRVEVLQQSKNYSDGLSMTAEMVYKAENVPNTSLYDGCSIILLVFCFFALAFKIIQNFTAGIRWDYITMENLFDVLLYSLTLIIVLLTYFGKFISLLVHKMLHALEGICLLLGILNILSTIRRLPTLGVFIVMFLEVVKRFLLCLPLLIVFIFGFGMLFYVIETEQEEFSNLLWSLAKTVVMIVGEIEYVDTVFHKHDGSQKNYKNGNPLIAIFIIAFIFIGIILLMNALIAFAAEVFTDGIKEKGELYRRKLQAEMILSLDRSLHDLEHIAKKLSPRLGEGLSKLQQRNRSFPDQVQLEERDYSDHQRFAENNDEELEDERYFYCPVLLSENINSINVQIEALSKKIDKMEVKLNRCEARRSNAAASSATPPLFVSDCSLPTALTYQPVINAFVRLLCQI
uniref:Ion_trans domain-containing protein n=1 Tax=Syphacia muris TaxID=451379 RepID=A0A0N5AQK9_9BILA